MDSVKQDSRGHTAAWLAPAPLSRMSGFPLELSPAGRTGAMDVGRARTDGLLTADPTPRQRKRQQRRSDWKVRRVRGHGVVNSTHTAEAALLQVWKRRSVPVGREAGPRHWRPRAASDPVQSAVLGLKGASAFTTRVADSAAAGGRAGEGGTWRCAVNCAPGTYLSV